MDAFLDWVQSGGPGQAEIGAASRKEVAGRFSLTEQQIRQEGIDNEWPPQ
jgi:hypothetical protein